MLPKLSPDQFLKLKQLTVLALSATTKILSYNELLEELEVCNVRELEDFLNNECVFAAGLPFSASATGNMLATSDNVFPLIEEKIDWASKICQFDMDHQQELPESKQGLCFWKNVDGFVYLGGLMEQEEDLIRSKRRRSHHNYSRGRPVYPHCVSQW